MYVWITHSPVSVLLAAVISKLGYGVRAGLAFPLPSTQNKGTYERESQCASEDEYARRREVCWWGAEIAARLCHRTGDIQPDNDMPVYMLLAECGRCVDTQKHCKV
jgi:hypothetical protein